MDTNFLGKAKKSVGIHPALAKRYAVSKEPPQEHSVVTEKVILSETAPPPIPGYEILEQIGKG
ncbi:MAG: hypothetical protein WCK42_05980, partial [Myxococcaceae bacterium]